jgi:hypothetical protein
VTTADGRDRPAAGTAPEDGPAGVDDAAGETASSAGPSTSDFDTAAKQAPPRPARRLSLEDPVARTAAEDRPEAWGESGESDADRLAHYRAQRPPHHGG